MPTTPHTRSGDRHRLLAAALAAANRGFHVFPLHPGRKTPALHGQVRCPGTGDCAHGHQGWEQRATRDPDRIHTWWAHRPHNIGIATGPSRLHVLDLDHAHGHTAPPAWRGAHHGRDVLTRLAHHHDQLYPGPTLTVTTPTGGEHLYFHAPADISLRSTVARLGWRIDSRGTGGYIIAPGSTTHHGTYTTSLDADIAKLPTWLLPLLQPPPPRTPPPRTHRFGEHADRARGYLNALLRRLTNTPLGQRRHTLLCCAYSLGRLTAGGEYTETDIRHALHRTVAGFPDFPTTEAERTIHDGLTHGQQHPRTFTD
jgi:hypothetical protein